MRQRPGIFRELALAQRLHIFDSLDRARSLIGGEFRIAIDGETFLQAQLEPVAQRDAIAGPVVKVLVADDALDVFEVIVGRCVGIGQQARRVEDVETFILHRAEIEVAHGHDVKLAEIVFAPKDALIPDHRTLQRFHGVTGTLRVALIRVNV